MINPYAKYNIFVQILQYYELAVSSLSANLSIVLCKNKADTCKSVRPEQ